MKSRQKLTWELADKLIAAATEEVVSEQLCPNPVVSVWMITYNHAPFIRQAIDSVLMQQTDFPFEIVIGDDCSTDGTTEIVLEYQRNFPGNVRVILASENLGRHTGNGRLNNIRTYRACRGEFIAMLDGDDYWMDAHKLQKQVTCLMHNADSVVCHHNAVVIDANGVQLKDSKLRHSQKRDFTQDELAGVAPLLTLTACFRNVIREFPAEFLLAPNGDTFLFSLLSAHGHSRYLGDEIKPDVYRVHAGGIWSPLSPNEKSWFAIKTCYLLARYYRRIGKTHYSMLLLERYCDIAFRQRWIPGAKALKATLSHASFPDIPLLLELALVCARHAARHLDATGRRAMSHIKKAAASGRRVRQRMAVFKLDNRKKSRTSAFKI